MKIDDISSTVEDTLSGEMKVDVDSLCTIIPQISKLICPVLQVGYDLQYILGGVNFKEVAVGDCGLWNYSVCSNASSGCFHTENDVT